MPAHRIEPGLSETQSGARSSLASPLASPSATRAVLERHGFATKKSLGQNFLVNDAIVRKIGELAEVSAGDTIMEVGPGIGTLTYAMLNAGASVVAIERDPVLPPVLDDTLGSFKERFSLISGDALDVIRRGLSACGYAGEDPDKLVSNLPYAVAATVVLDCFQSMPLLKSATVMVQREVAERMCARPATKAYGAYTVKLSMHAKPEGSFQVGPGNFMPPPHVDSTVLRLNRHALALPDVAKAASTMADAAFFARRKTIANSCRQYFASRDSQVAAAVPEILERAGIEPRARGEKLSPEQYINLGQALIAVRA